MQFEIRQANWRGRVEGVWNKRERLDKTTATSTGEFVHLRENSFEFVYLKTRPSLSNQHSFRLCCFWNQKYSSHEPKQHFQKDHLGDHCSACSCLPFGKGGTWRTSCLRRLRQGLRRPDLRQFSGIRYCILPSHHLNGHVFYVFLLVSVLASCLASAVFPPAFAWCVSAGMGIPCAGAMTACLGTLVAPTP